MFKPQTTNNEIDLAFYDDSIGTYTYFLNDELKEFSNIEDLFNASYVNLWGMNVVENENIEIYSNSIVQQFPPYGNHENFIVYSNGSVVDSTLGNINNLTIYSGANIVNTDITGTIDDLIVYESVSFRDFGLVGTVVNMTIYDGNVFADLRNFYANIINLDLTHCTEEKIPISCNVDGKIINIIGNYYFDNSGNTFYKYEPLIIENEEIYYQEPPLTVYNNSQIFDGQFYASKFANCRLYTGEYYNCEFKEGNVIYDGIYNQCVFNTDDNIQIVGGYFDRCYFNFDASQFGLVQNYDGSWSSSS